MSDHREAIAEALHPWLDGTPNCPYRPANLCPNVRRAKSLADALLGSDVLAQIRAEARAEAWDEGWLAAEESWGHEEPNEVNPYRAGGSA